MTDLQSKQKGESSPAYQAYLDYRDMGVTRSLAKLQQRYDTHTSPTDCPTTRLGTLEKWSSKFAWQSRITQWEEHLQEEKDKQAASARIIERQQRADMLEKMRNKIEKQMMHADLSTEEGIKAFTALTRAFKAYMELSMKQYNDLPVKHEEVTSRAINVNFNTEPIPEDIVNERLASLGLLSYIEDQTE